ncbi:MAG: DsrE family protein [Desulfuromonadales bacterium]|nr:DsrE family protein [Desulfuromonadales bacterium]
MKFFLIPALVLLALLSQPISSFALDDKLAFSGLNSTRAIYDVSSNDEKKLQFIFKVIRDTYDGATQQGVKQTTIVSMRGPTVRLLVRGRQGDKVLQQETVELINELTERDIRLEACGYALNLFGVEPEDLYAGINAVGNSLNSVVGYQTKGYALVSMN